MNFTLAASLMNLMGCTDVQKEVGPEGQANAALSNIVPVLHFPRSIKGTINVPIEPISPSNTGGLVESCETSSPLPSGLSLARDCTISGTPNILSISNSFIITGKNSAGTAFAEVTIEIVDASPILNSPPKISLRKGTEIRLQPFSNSGGNILNCNYDPPLPNGLHATNNCELLGTPNDILEETNFAIRASNSGGSHMTSVLIEILDQPPSISFSPSVRLAQIKQAMTNIMPTNTGGPITRCTIAPALPLGLSLSSDCIVSGTPTQIGTFNNLLVRASNSGGIAEATLTLTIVDEPPRLIQQQRFNLAKAQSISSLQIQNTGGPAVTCASAVLPPGLSLSNQCALFGRPVESGNFLIHIVAENSGGHSETDVGITVLPGVWALLAGDETYPSFGVYNAEPDIVPIQTPGSRTGAANWTGRDGALYLFGGLGMGESASGALNDFWRFSNGTWQFIGGKRTVNDPGNYGIQGVSHSENLPPARSQATTWVDHDGNFWLFGGKNFFGWLLADLWKFDGTMWTWVAGASGFYANGVYGTMGVSDATNSPGARAGANGLVDSLGRLILFGGEGVGISGSSVNNLNDLWRFDGTAWTWLAGATQPGDRDFFESKGAPSPTNRIGGRYLAAAWIDRFDRIWIYGGRRNSPNGGGPEITNMLVRIDGNAVEWLDGVNQATSCPEFGSIGQASHENNPGPLLGAASGQDANDNFYLFAGIQQNTFGCTGGRKNQLWRLSENGWTLLSLGDENGQGFFGDPKGMNSLRNHPSGSMTPSFWVTRDATIYSFSGGQIDSTFFQNQLWRFQHF